MARDNETLKHKRWRLKEWKAYLARRSAELEEAHIIIKNAPGDMREARKLIKKIEKELSMRSKKK